MIILCKRMIRHIGQPVFTFTAALKYYLIHAETQTTKAAQLFSDCLFTWYISLFDPKSRVSADGTAVLSP